MGQNKQLLSTYSCFSNEDRLIYYLYLVHISLVVKVVLPFFVVNY